jgi:putative ABC transport system permease protein
MPLWVVGLALGISSSVGIVSGIIPAFTAARMDPVDALRYE